jgi:general stress protein YciG
MNLNRQAWEENCHKRFPHLSKEEAILEARRLQSEYGSRNKGIKKPTSGFASDRKRAREAGKKGNAIRWGNANKN